jgi:uncharacterized protein YegL
MYGTTQSQVLSVELQDLNFLGLPRVTFTACISMGDTLLPALDERNFVLTENGNLQQFIIRCPDPGVFNSVILVMDNSGSIGPVLPKLIEAGSILVDSLGVNDEAALITFGRDLILAQDFTTNKPLLNNQLALMIANGGTPLRDAAFQACKELEKRSGNRHAVIITDGMDTQSTLQTVDPIIQLANSIDAKLHTIAFALGSEAGEQEMRRMAEETGGLFFSVQRPGQLKEVYEQIASLITEPCCVGEYFSNNCIDSIRTIHLDVEAKNQTASSEITVSTPYRPEQMRIWVEVPPDLSPLASGTGYILIDPPPDEDLELNMALRIRFNDDLIDITPQLPLSLGTLTQNQLVSMQKTRPGEMEFVFSGIKPAMFTNRLVGFPVQALRSDSSRTVAFVFVDSVALEGCPVNFDLQPDTTKICLCFQKLDVEIEGNGFIKSGETVAFPVRIPGGLVPGVGAQLTVEVLLPGDVQLESITSGDLFDPNAIQWQQLSDGWIRIEIPGFAMPQSSEGIFVNLITDIPFLQSAKIFSLDFRNLKLLHKCCPELQDEFTIPILVDGLCDKIIRRRAEASISTAPNPVGGARGDVSNIHVNFNHSHQGGHYTLALVDVNGNIIVTIAEQQFEAGEYIFALNSAGLANGSYMVVLFNDQERVSDNIMVIR